MNHSNCGPPARSRQGWRVARTRLMKLVILLLFLILPSGTRGARALAQGSDESQVKAAFLFNFAKFVEWPSESFNDNQAPIIVGVVGEDSTSSAIDQMIKGTTANGRRLK